MSTNASTSKTNIDIPANLIEIDKKIFIRRKENFTFNPDSGNKPEYPEWVPAQIRTGWIFLALALLLSLFVTFVGLGPGRIERKWRGWVDWYEHSEHIRVGLLYPQLPIHVASGVFSVVGPIFILRVLEVPPTPSAERRESPLLARNHRRALLSSA